MNKQIIKLKNAVKQGDKEIESIALDAIQLHHLFGLKLSSIVSLEADTLISLIVRLSGLNQAVIERLSLSDLTQIGTHIIEDLGRESQIPAGYNLREPTAGDLRGLSLTNAMYMEVNTIKTLIVRLSGKSEQEVINLSAQEFMALSVEVANFFI